MSCKIRCWLLFSALPLILLHYVLVAPISCAECSLRNGIRVAVNSDFVTETGSLEYRREEDDGETKPSVCEWLIYTVANSTVSSETPVINLDIQAFSSLCGEGYLYIYDGNSRGAPLLLATSNVQENGTATVVTAVSGEMLVALQLTGRSHFRAQYRVERCSGVCSTHGVCLKRACQCRDGWMGESCGVARCPHGCHSLKDQGRCNAESGLCSCNKSYSGEDCSFPSGNPAPSRAVRAKAFRLTAASRTSNIGPRSGHASAITTLDGHNCLWVFGGHSGSDVLAGLIIYNFTSSQWLHVDHFDNGLTPAARYHHSMVAVGHRCLYLFGGELSDGTRTNEMWRFDIAGRRWTLLSDHTVVPVSLHSMSLNRTSLIVFGGYTNVGEESNDMLRFDLSSNDWDRVTIHPESWFGLSERLKLAGHTTVVHEELNMLIVFGGFMAENQEVVASSGLFAFHLAGHYWMELPNSNDLLPPLHRIVQRALHTATVFGNYMLVYGGWSNQSPDQGDCSAGTSPILYDFTCYRWIPWSKLPARRHTVLQSLRRYGHSASKLGDNRLVVLGGFHGNAHNDLTAVQLPTDLTEYDPVPSCYDRSNMTSCLDAVQCVWCQHVLDPRPLPAGVGQGAALCIPTVLAGQVCHEVQSDLGKCFDLCSSQRFCSDCLKWRSGYEADSQSVCSWCPEYDSTPSCRQAALPRGRYCRTLEHCGETREPFSVFTRQVYSGANGRNRTVYDNSTSFTFRTGRGTTPYRQVVGYGGINPLAISQNCNINDSNDSPITGCSNRSAQVTVSVIRGKIWIDAGADEESMETIGRVVSPRNSSDPMEGKFYVPLSQDGRRIVLRAVAEPDQGIGNESSGNVAISPVRDDENGLSAPFGSFNSNLEEQTLSSRLSKRALLSSLESPSSPLPPSVTTVPPSATQATSAPSVADLASRDGTQADSSSSVASVSQPTTQRARWTPPAWDLAAAPVAFHFYRRAALRTGVVQTCALHQKCVDCSRNRTCVWCPYTGLCMLAPGTGCNDAASNTSALVDDWVLCLSCSDRDDCSSCLSGVGCEWNMNGHCQKIGSQPNSTVAAVKAECPLACSLRSGCDQCMEAGFARPCVWCVTTGKCHDQAHMPLVNAYGQCSMFFSDNPALCRNCSARTTCSQCVGTPSPMPRDQHCGWCVDVNNPPSGRCVSGGYDGPAGNETCSSLYGSDVMAPPTAIDVMAPTTATSNESDVMQANQSSWGWFFWQCPLLDWCAVSSINCSANASCSSDVDSAACTCSAGFTGDGVQCTEWCHVPCGKNGQCSGPPLLRCECALGWTGEVCDVDCECNGLSTCTKGRGICDQCQNGTAGRSCEFCQVHYFRTHNSTSSGGCESCSCNGKADENLGSCNATTGKCFCLRGYAGDHCESCSEGYNSHRISALGGNVCIKLCDTRMVTQSSENAEYVTTLDRRPGLSAGQPHCVLVILAVDRYMDDALRYVTQDNISEIVSPQRAIELQVDLSLTPCGNESLIVYDQLQVDSNAARAARVVALLPQPATAAVARSKFYSLSGVMTVFLPVFNDDLYFVTVHHRSLPCTDCPTPAQACVASDSDSIVCNGLHTVTGCRDCPFRCDKNSGQCNCFNPALTGGKCDVKISDREPWWRTSSTSKVVAQDWHDVDLCTETQPCPMTTFPPRYLHSAVSSPSRRGADNLYVFGGVDATGQIMSSNVLVVSTANHTWYTMKTSHGVVRGEFKSISPRYGHSALLFASQMYVLGGILDDNSTSSELWFLDITTGKWTFVRPYSSAFLGRAFHTMTYVNGSNMLLIGGYGATSSGVATSISCQTVDEFDALLEQWSPRQTHGPAPSVYGHTGSYMKEDSGPGSVWVTGGHQYLPGHISDGKLENGAQDFLLFRLRLSDWTWEYHQPSPQSAQIPSYLFWHQTVVFHESMLLFIGGKTKDCQPPELFFFSVGCGELASFNNSRLQGYPVDYHLSHHTATLSSDGSSAFILGGVTGGSVSGDLRQLLFSASAQDWCTLIEDKGSCQSFSDACVWCHYEPSLAKNTTTMPPSSGCLPRSKYAQCSDQGGRHTLDCSPNGGRCSDIQTCLGCTSHAGCSYNNNAGTSLCETENTSSKSKLPLMRWEDCQVQGSRCNLTDTCQSCMASYPTCSSPLLVSNRSMTGVTSLVGLCTGSSDDENIISDSGCNAQCSSRCPVPCSAHRSCSKCVASVSYTTSNQRRCQWSQSLHACLSGDESDVLCPGMRCAPLATRASQCPVTDCLMFAPCYRCRQAVGCGWCGSEGGSGACLNGGTTMPDRCRLFDPAYENWNKLSTVHADSLGTDNNTWHYFDACPPIDECSQQVHDCSPSQVCVDKRSLYECTCAPGHASRNHVCVPICQPACGLHGTCVSPNQCNCTRGWTGALCNTWCLCNGHSACANDSAVGRKTCLKCDPETRGDQCERCAPGYVNISSSNEPLTCRSCLEFCNWNSKTCQNVHVDDALSNVTKPLTKANAVCVNCANNTIGPQCRSCKEGYFFSPRSQQPRGAVVCRRCECNGHGMGSCGTRGNECDCQNNTESSGCYGLLDDCYVAQCNRCKSPYIGEPTLGKQCYQLLSPDHAYVRSLAFGTTLFFSIPPRYTNVDIRLTVMSHIGKVDVWLVKSSDVLSVEAFNGQQFVYTQDGNGSNGKSQLCTATVSVEASGVTYSNPPLVVTVNDQLFHKCNFQGELIMRFPHYKHSLSEQKFFLAVRALALKPSRNISDSSAAGVGATNVTLYYQQDLLQIDLIIFFSCFFSCFFLLLLLSMALWRLKYVYQEHQRGLDAVATREQNASRPHVQVKLRLPSRNLAEDDCGLLAVDGLDDRCQRRDCLISHQPIRGEKVWLSTSFVRLPGPSGPQMALASALTLAPAEGHSPLLAGLRRRAFNSYSAQMSRPWRNRQYQYDINRVAGDAEPAVN